MSILIDTSIAVFLRDDAEAIAARLAELNVRPAISVITRVELEGGVYADPRLSARRRSGLDKVLARLPVIDFTSGMAAHYRRLVASLGFSRRTIIDRMIAATALDRDLTLITCNGSDFVRIPDLKLEVWTL